uniref:uncharacterized protein LOC118533011 n=1 Tax=Halichoerus grypus TaxID=9711 RepID=UPI0016590354|nr:uncharacterized protein LOC118533011 [Halichoerus grypus]
MGSQEMSPWVVGRGAFRKGLCGVGQARRGLRVGPVPRLWSLGHSEKDVCAPQTRPKAPVQEANSTCHPCLPSSGAWKRLRGCRGWLAPCRRGRSGFLVLVTRSTPSRLCSLPGAAVTHGHKQQTLLLSQMRESEIEVRAGLPLLGASEGDCSLPPAHLLETARNPCCFRAGGGLTPAPACAKRRQRALMERKKPTLLAISEGLEPCSLQPGRGGLPPASSRATP